MTDAKPIESKVEARMSNGEHAGSIGRADRWVGVGSSTGTGSHQAGSEAASQALAGRSAALLIVFCSDSHDLEELLRGINEASGSAPLIGCSTAGEIASTGPTDLSVVVTALGGDGFSVATAAASLEAERLDKGGAEVAACLLELEEREHQVLLLLTDGLAGNQQEIVRGAYSVAGAGVALVGGCAGDDLKMTATAQLHGSQVLKNAVVAAAVGSDAPLGIGVRHGWRRVGEPMVVTKSADNRVYSLDGRPALDVYLSRLEAPAEAAADSAAFTRFAMTHPLGLVRRGQEEHVRYIADADFEDRSLGCIAEVPQGGMAWIMQGDDASVLEATDQACSDALDALGDRSPLGLIAFDCIARRGVLGEDGIQKEIGRIAEHAVGAPVSGFYTYGEIARTSGIAGFHNQTLVVLALS
jgi:hypothetical protein